MVMEIINSTVPSFYTKNKSNCTNSSSASNCTTPSPEPFTWYVFFVRECTYPTGVLAFLALFLNAGVVTTLRRVRSEKKSAGGQSFVQLTALAIVDFCFCATYFAALLWRICIDAAITDFDDITDQVR